LRLILDEELSTRLTVPNRDTRWWRWDADTVEKRPFDLTLDDITTDQRKRIEALLRVSDIPVNDATVLEAFIEARTRR
jgi:hypothetical protein